MLKLYCCDVSALTDEQFLRMYQSLDRQRQKKADRLKRDPAKKLSVAAGMLARRGIALQLHIDPKQISFRNTKNGKPYAEGLDIHFSLSHSGSMAVCAVSDRPVGIDVEKNKPVHLGVVKKCFTKAEQRYVLAGKEKTQERFLEIWTKKEAYVKMMGTGIQDFLTFDVLKNDKVYTIQYKNYTVSVAEK